MHRLYKAVALGLLGTFAVASQAQQTQSAQPEPGLSLQPRIVGGVEISISQTPATAALLSTSRVELDGNLFQAQFCGGTVIAPRWILTAAHCVLNLNGTVMAPSSIMILTGSDDLAFPADQPIPVHRIITHREYRSVELGRDIALIQLAYDTSVEPVSLDTQPVLTDDLAFIAGWGAVNSGDDGRNQQFPTHLRGTFVNMTEGSDCGSLFPDYAGYTDGTTICAGVADGGKDSCQGDSGGPLYRVEGPDGRIVAVTGVTSWGIGCGIAEYPGIYTNVVSYVDWIQENIRTANALPDTDVSNNPTSATLPAADDPLASNNDTLDAFGQGNDNADTVFTGSASGALMIILGLMLMMRQGLFYAFRSDT